MYFILAVLPDSTNWIQFESVCRQLKIYLKPIENQSLKSQIGDIRAGLVSTRNDHCECDSSIGWDHKPHPQSEDSEKREREKMKKKGWSEAKINRALADRGSANQASSNNQELDSWLAFINATVKNSRSLSLLLHFYSGDIAKKTIKISKKVQMKIATCERKTLTAIQCDTLYSFTL